MSRDDRGELLRAIGLPGAVLMGLGSIIGTGLFVSLGIAAGVAGEWIVPALFLAALLALCNGLSSAQLAAAHPVSGGTYEYGYRFLTPAFGFTGGLAFLLAKSASAATAALGLGGYLLLLLGVPAATVTRVAIAAGVTVLITVLVAGGIRRSNRSNTVIVGVTLAALLLFLGAGLPRAMEAMGGLLTRGVEGEWVGTGALLHATALLFVAYTGYGRIATLGEEVRDPGRTIPAAIWITLGVVAFLYVGVAAVATGTVGAERFAGMTAETAAPLQGVAAALEVPGLVPLVGLAAVTAMAGVLLNLILGLSRVALAMGRRGDLPALVGRVEAGSGSPRAAVVAVGALITALVLAGDVRLTWSFAAFTVLVYYGITNLAALRLPEAARLYPRWVAVLGLVGCGLLAFHVEAGVWGVGLAVLLLGLGGRAIVRARA